jgi:nucleoside triphosphate pyrophosphatase
VPFEARAAGVEELAQGRPDAVALANARRKADAVAEAAGGRPVLAVDTLVALGGRLYGQPADEAQARATLDALCGRTHTVVSGLCLVQGERRREGVESTAVSFRAAKGALLDAYLATGEWRGRAGAYAIQERGALLVRRIEGDYLNVVGLPVGLLLDLAPEVVG